MKSVLYKKTKKDFKILPNLEEYERMYARFSWNDWKKELAWFEDGKINAAYNAVDRHVDTWRKNKIALYWEADDGTQKKYTFEDVAMASNKMGNILKDFDVDRGDRVFIFLPRIPELFFSFLGILKIGAIAGTLFSAFQEQALQDRLENSDAKVLITNSVLKPRVDKIRKKLPNLKHILVVDTETFTKTFANTSSELQIGRASCR